MARNAIKHGLLAREVVITAGDGEESLEEFHALIKRLWEYYEPVGVVEESLVQTIATCWWRKARVIRAENGEIRKRLDALTVDRALRNSDQSNLALALSEMGNFSLSVPRTLLTGRCQQGTDGLPCKVPRPMCGDISSGLAYLSALLDKGEIRDRQRWLNVGKRIRKRIFFAFGLWDYLFALTCLQRRSPRDQNGRPTIGRGCGRKT